MSIRCATKSCLRVCACVRLSMNYGFHMAQIERKGEELEGYGYITVEYKRIILFYYII